MLGQVASLPILLICSLQIILQYAQFSKSVLVVFRQRRQVNDALAAIVVILAGPQLTFPPVDRLAQVLPLAFRLIPACQVLHCFSLPYLRLSDFVP